MINVGLPRVRAPLASRASEYPPKGNSNSHGARPVHLIITMIKWIRTSRLSIKNSLASVAKSRRLPTMAHTRQSGLGFQIKALETLEGVPSSLGRGRSRTPAALRASSPARQQPCAQGGLLETGACVATSHMPPVYFNQLKPLGSVEDPTGGGETHRACL